jgi:hypothetical protein
LVGEVNVHFSRYDLRVDKKGIPMQQKECLPILDGEERRCGEEFGLADGIV